MKNINKYNHKDKHWEKYGKINTDQAIVDNVPMVLAGIANGMGDIVRGEWPVGAKYTYDIVGHTYFWKPISGGK